MAEVTTWNDEKEFADCHESLFKLGFSEQQRDELYRMLCTCLNLGNLDFKESKEGDIPDQKLLAKCADQLQVEAKLLRRARLQDDGWRPSTYKSPNEEGGDRAQPHHAHLLARL